MHKVLAAKRPKLATLNPKGPKFDIGPGRCSASNLNRTTRLMMDMKISSEDNRDSTRFNKEPRVQSGHCLVDRYIEESMIQPRMASPC